MLKAIVTHVRFFSVNDVIYLTEDFEIQAWANDLVETDPLLGCIIKVAVLPSGPVMIISY